LVLVSHLGRPSGEPDQDAPFRMDRVAARLGELLGRPVTKVDDTVGPGAQSACAALKPGDVVVLENVRFNPGEKKGDPEFARQLAALADMYVNDAFGTCHRDEASMVAVPECFPAERRAIGFLVEKELQILDRLLGNPRTPMVAIMGGAKVSDKIGVIENLLPKVDRLLIGGAMTYTFLKAQGHQTGKSRVEADKLDEARRLLELAGPKLVLPPDHLVALAVEPTAETRVVVGWDLPEETFGLDIGPATATAYNEIIRNAGTVIWNGPMGKFEDEPFQKGTRRIAEAMAGSSAVTVVGGGETAEAVEQFGFADAMTHVSTGGGAFLEALEGKEFNSLRVIPDQPG
jgi:phosphoglycerate kinase